ncbi:MAG: CoA pyrophosphatase, partial [Ilumatobacter fluminis]
VLVTLADGAEGPEVLLTRRSWEMRNHRGEISFPGGRIDPGETPTLAALREAHEEVGLEPAGVAVRGELSHLNTVASRSYIVPKVATIDLPARPELTGQTMEVDRVLWVPLAELTRPDTYHSERWKLGPTDHVLHFFQLDDETIWGATARMLVDLLDRTLT